MDTALQELIYQFMAILGSGLIGWIGLEVKSYIAKKKAIMGYEFDNDKMERIINNAVDYAETRGNEYFKVQAKKMASSEKLDTAREYINMVDAKKVQELGNTLDAMISRKVSSKYGSK